ncbi:MAG: hypothetical protein AB1730_26380 [Myxococcota bacterium]|jgi:hypothetical protein
MRPVVSVALALALGLLAACRKPATVADAGAAPPPPHAGVKAPCASFLACQAACDAKDGLACARAASFAFAGVGAARDVPLAWRLEWRGCEAGHGASCARVGLSAAAGLASLDAGIAKDALGRAGPLVRTACEAGDAEACELTAALARAGHLEADAGTFTSRARTLLGAACDAGDAQACNRLGSLLFETETDSSAAVAALDRGCTLGLAGACATLGLRYLAGKGVAADAPKAQKLLARARLLSADAGAP